jgi:hypothetical protein
MYFLLRGLVKLGQPIPESYLSVEIKRGSPEILSTYIDTWLFVIPIGIIERRLCPILLSYIILPLD